MMKRAILFGLVLCCIVFVVSGCKPKDPNAGMVAENEKLKIQNGRLQEEIERLQRELNELGAERTEWRDKFYTSSTELEKLKGLVERLKGESSELQGKLDELQRERQKLEEEKESLAKKLSNVEGVVVSRKGDEILLTVDNLILFDSGSAEIKSSANKAIQAIASALTGDFMSRRIRIEGHTDTDPIRKSAAFPSNWELSTARACTVLHSLKKAGVEEARMHVAGYAYFRPVAANDSDANKAKNRRVEIYILPEEK
ncbi:MAG: hypothetical protein Kow00107_10160 [Planctomycetota bacterium]